MIRNYGDDLLENKLLLDIYIVKETATQYAKILEGFRLYLSQDSYTIYPALGSRHVLF